MQEHTALIEQIALYLGAPWKVNYLEAQSCWQRSIIDGTGRALIISKPYNAKKFNISGSFPRGITTAHHADYKKIGVSFNRPPKDIAADITRRLLPHYLAAFESAKQRFFHEQQQKQKLDHVAQALVKVTGGRTLSHYGDGRRHIYFDHGEAELWGSSCDIKLTLRSLSPEQAIQIAAMVSKPKAPP